MDHPLLTTISHVGNVVDEELERNLSKIGLSPTHLGALSHIYEHSEPIALSELAKNKGCVKSNITQLIDRMGKEGLVERIRSEEDRRKVLTVLTPKGKDAYLKGVKILKETEKKILSRLSGPQRKKLADLLGLISGE